MKIWEIEWTNGLEYEDNHGDIWTVDTATNNLITLVREEEYFTYEVPITEDFDLKTLLELDFKLCERKEKTYAVRGYGFDEDGIEEEFYVEVKATNELRAMQKGKSKLPTYVYDDYTIDLIED